MPGAGHAAPATASPLRFPLPDEATDNRRPIDAVLSVRLCDEEPDQGIPRRARGLQGHHPLLPARREDRRARRQRRRQVDAAQDHGRHRDRVRRRSLGRGGRARRLSLAGAASRARSHRLRERGPRLRAAADGARALQRDLARIRRTDGRRADERAARRAGRAAGEDRGRGWLGARPAHRDRARRAALPAARQPGHQPLRRRAPPRRAVPAAAREARAPAARRAHQPSRRRKRRLARAHACASTRAR